MKNLKFLALVSLTVILMSACTKKPIYPTSQLPANVPNSTIFNGTSGWGEFKVIGGHLYCHNIDADTSFATVYDHFGPNKHTSSLRWGGSEFDIETIDSNVTTYSFYKPTSYPGNGRFILNGDTTKFYCVNYIGQYRSIVEDPTHGQINLGGSSRPFTAGNYNASDSTMDITIEDMTGSVNGHNFEYHSVLKLKKIKSW